MNIIITAGGTCERIDNVRNISNIATGTLGSLIAGELAVQAANWANTIYYICGKNAVLPAGGRTEIISIDGVGQLRDALTGLLSTKKIDAIIHSMAVSDYTVGAVSTVERLSRTIAQKLAEEGGADDLSAEWVSQVVTDCICAADPALIRDGKLSSEHENLVLTLQKTPKIIGLIKQLQPTTVLVGFKLLDGVNEQTLLSAGYNLLIKNNCDFVLANDRQTITEHSHAGLLIKPDRSYEKRTTKKEIAEIIVKRVLEQIEKSDTR